jgi:SAM-dependent methyltransferase
MITAEWFKDWFNSPYYHLLYNKRNENEAKFFIDNLCSSLDLAKNSNVWDLACGKGRHSICLNQRGFKVVGTDLSQNSIVEASQNSNPTLDFFVHDMRDPFRINYFDAVFNLFTSIGYFENFNDNFSVFKNVANSLKPNGVFVIDFLNSENITTSINSNYEEQRGDLTFKIEKKIENNSIIKRIEFNDNNKDFYFEESVSLLKKEDFENFANASGLKTDCVFGNYKLEPFDKNTSERLIIIFKK